jgi:acyl CoA:acetate/3-ketoacid CoA transferase
MNAAEAADRIKDGDTIAISGNGAGMVSAEEILAAIEKRFLDTGHPRDLTLVHSLGLGDRDSLGTNRFAHEGMARRVVLTDTSNSGSKTSMIGVDRKP